MQIVSLEDNLHEMSMPILLKKWNKYKKFAICWICPESGKSHNNVTGLYIFLTL